MPDRKKLSDLKEKMIADAKRLQQLQINSINELFQFELENIEARFAVMQKSIRNRLKFLLFSMKVALNQTQRVIFQKSCISRVVMVLFN